jgi:hypothetical protein
MLGIGQSSRNQQREENLKVMRGQEMSLWKGEGDIKIEQNNIDKLTKSEILVR